MIWTQELRTHLLKNPPPLEPNDAPIVKTATPAPKATAKKTTKKKTAKKK